MEPPKGGTTYVEENFWRNKAEQSGTVEMAEGFWGDWVEIVKMAEGFAAEINHRGTENTEVGEDEVISFQAG